MTYVEKLKDPRWQQRRLRIFDRDGWSCCFCNRKDKTLHVHHRRYIPKQEPWDYPDNLLITLCEDCHEQETQWLDIAKQSLLRVIGDHFGSDEIAGLSSALSTAIECDGVDKHVLIDLLTKIAMFPRARLVALQGYARLAGTTSAIEAQLARDSSAVNSDDNI